MEEEKEEFILNWQHQYAIIKGIANGYDDVKTEQFLKELHSAPEHEFKRFFEKNCVILLFEYIKCGHLTALIKHEELFRAFGLMQDVIVISIKYAHVHILLWL